MNSTSILIIHFLQPSGLTFIVSGEKWNLDEWRIKICLDEPLGNNDVMHVIPRKG